MAVVLLVLPWVLAWLLVRHQHLDLPTKVAVVGGVAAASAAFPVAWLTWAMYRDAKESAAQGGDLTLAQVADQLAVAVGAQWEAEAAIRRLNDPYPLPVSWDPADASLTDDWQSLVMLAESGAGWPALPPEGTWAAGQEGLAGAGSDLVNVLARVPTGRLVVLGEPGAGKTMLMVRLVLDLLARRPAGGPVPILAPLASWDPAKQDLPGWLAGQLVIDHAALAGAPPAERGEPTRAIALLASGLILPVLDGLDEIPEQVRGSAISRINDALRPGEHLVVTCRSQQYQDAIRPKKGVEVTLRGAAAVQLQPLDADAVRGYLCDDAGGPVAKARWEPVLNVLGTKSPAGQVLQTPLMVGLARAVYNPRPGELAEALRSPAELCSPSLTDRTAVESLLFDAFIPAAYRHDLAGRWEAQDAEKWLVFLARHLENKVASPDLAWWQLLAAARFVPLFVAWAVLGAVLGAVVGAVTGAVAGAGAVVGAVVGALVGAILIVMARRQKSREPAKGIRWRPPRPFVFMSGLVTGVTFGVIAGVTYGVRAGAVAGAVAGVLSGALGWSVDQTRAPIDVSSAASPPAVLAQDRRSALVVGAVTGAVVGFVFGVAAGIANGIGFGIGVGVLFAFAVGVVDSFSEAAWPSYEIARVWLALNRELPWPLMGFLADAHRRGVLRQAGAVYQFRHIELQHRLATRSAKTAGVPEAPGSGSVAAPGAPPNTVSK